MLRCSVAVIGAPALVAACRRREGAAGDAAVEAAAGSTAAPRESGPRPALPVTEPVVRVRVARVRAGPITLGHDEQWVRAESVEEPSRAVVLSGPVTVGAEPDNWSLLDGKGFRPAIDHLEPLEFSSIDPRDPLLRVNDQPHPGRMRVVARTDDGPGAFDVVNHVPLEAYLPGVLARELFSHWHHDAFMAQAIAARSFACAEHGYFRRRRHFDLTNTARSQVYGGSVRNERAIDAVAMTRGAVLAYRGRLVPGYYSSCCGGVSARAADTIGSNPVNDVPPLDGAGIDDACREAPVFSWRVQRRTSVLARGFAEFAAQAPLPALADLESIDAIEVSAVNPHGRPRRYAVIGRESGRVELPAETLRRAVNSTASARSSPRRRLLSSNVTVTIDGDDATFHGHGFGHGVGLCQYGAQARARAGEGHEQIVRRYYPDAEIVRTYG